MLGQPDVLDILQEMEKAQAKGEIAEDELRALEMDVTGKVWMDYHRRMSV